MSDVLVVDDERSMREFLEILLSKEGVQVRTAQNVAQALGQVEERIPDLVITDLQMKGGTGIDLLRDVKLHHPEVEFIVITAFATNETALEALKMGAYDYITKPFQVDEIRVVVQRALERKRLLRENVRLRSELDSRYDFGRLVGKGARMQEVYRLIEQVAPTRSNVLITGESGTGKELVARALHDRSERSRGPFVPIDCGSIPDSLMESELFGHIKGAYTGADTTRKGLFELADRGTVFLDEVGEVATSLQVKLLRVIQERSLKRLGDGTDREVDVRILAATNRDLEAEVGRGAFREDLYYRLNVIRIRVPPLRERRTDIVDLVHHFVSKVSAQEGRPAPPVLKDAIEALVDYDFPGNVRELENMVERALALSGNRPIGKELFTEGGRSGPGSANQADDVFPKEGLDLDALLQAQERVLIKQALRASGGVKKEAARLLSISFRSFRYRLTKLGLDREGG